MRGTSGPVWWPWWDIDTGSDFLHWNGIVAPDVEAELFRTDPPSEQLKAGDTCLVGVPPTMVHVTAVDHHAPRSKRAGYRARI